ncbi:hypothetical protein [Mucilaginibacter agri]|uniref:Uncharacterized protein n=1 Tax=Mucilaginibacter agri TaxID=2695265 RepID=A0A966DUF2_9SPHI|nr:hypothetical protein [Mucilaginibacter agri]NCD72308.1 hypothetical protein [Mucilaginibacter agri]
MEKQLDRVSDKDHNLLTVKVPIRLPYQTNWKNFERVDGEVTFKGNTYRYVKQKISNDTLILLCINYQEKNLLKKSSSDYYQKANDNSNNTSKTSLSLHLKQEYLSLNSFLLPGLNGVEHLFKAHTVPQDSPGYHRLVDSPPDFTTTLNC